LSLDRFFIVIFQYILGVHLRNVFSVLSDFVYNGQTLFSVLPLREAAASVYIIVLPALSNLNPSHIRTRNDTIIYHIQGS